MFKINKKRQEGFSFIESMLAVFLVSVGVVAAIGLLASSLKYTYSARDQFIASLLAQEGVEIVRNIRDNTWVDSNPITSSFSTLPITAGAGKICVVDKNDNDITSGSLANSSTIHCYAYSVANLAKTELKLNAAKTFYIASSTGAWSTGIDTKFYRKIEYDYCNFDLSNCGLTNDAIGKPSSVRVTSFVSWSGSGPTADTSKLNTCNTATKCAYAQTILNKWGE